MAFEALVLSRDLPVNRASDDPAASPNRGGFFQFLFRAVIASRQRAADREVARYLELRGNPPNVFTGSAERSPH